MTTTNLTKRQQLEQTLLELVKDYPVCVRLAQALFADEELSELQDYCNNVSIRRLGFNDHGPVHMRQVAVNATRLLFLLRDAGLRTSLETEEYGTFEDSLCAVLLAGFCHDLGMSVGRQQHEDMSALYVLDASRRLLTEALPDDVRRRTVVRALALEAVVGHMGNRRIHSLEAGVVLVGDGCDMTRGRSRITMRLGNRPTQGDIHKFSAYSIKRVHIASGVAKPIRIDVEMESEVGLFQIEEVLMPKIRASTIAGHIELCASVEGGEVRRYLE